MAFLICSFFFSFAVCSSSYRNIPPPFFVFSGTYICTYVLLYCIVHKFFYIYCMIYVVTYLQKTNSFCTLQRVIIFPATAFPAPVVSPKALDKTSSSRARQLPCLLRVLRRDLQVPMPTRDTGPAILKSTPIPSYERKYVCIQRHWLQNVCGAGSCHIFLGITLDA